MLTTLALYVDSGLVAFARDQSGGYDRVFASATFRLHQDLASLV